MQWGTVANWELLSWIAAILVAAVVVLSAFINVVRFCAHLWQTRNVRKIKLHGSCYVTEKDLPREPDCAPQLISNSHQAPDTNRPQKEDRLCLLIRNDGDVSATIRNIKLDRFKNVRGVLPVNLNDWLTKDGRWLSGADPDSCKLKLPINIAGGAEEEWTFSLARVAKRLVEPVWVTTPPNAKVQIEKASKTKAETKNLRFRVYTGFGKHTAIKPNKQVVDAIIKAIDENKEKWWNLFFPKKETC